MANGNIRLAPPQVADVVGGEDFNLDPRCQIAQAHQDGRKEIGGKRIAGGDADLPADGLRLAGGRKRYGIGSLAHGAEVIQEFDAGRRDRQRPPDPVEQGDAKLFFQRRDLTRQGGLGQPQGAGGGRQIARLCRGKKGAGLIPVKGGRLPTHAFLYNPKPDFRNFFRKRA